MHNKVRKRNYTLDSWLSFLDELLVSVEKKTYCEKYVFRLKTIKRTDEMMKTYFVRPK